VICRRKNGTAQHGEEEFGGGGEFRHHGPEGAG